jgi:hypothetical protein
MKWKLNEYGQIEDERGVIVCILPENPSDYDSTLIRFAPEMFEAIMEFCGSLEKTVYPRNPKKHYTRFQQILENMIRQHK